MTPGRNDRRADDATPSGGERPARRRVLCLALVSPERSHDGDAIRVLGLLRAVSARHDTHLITASGEPDVSPAESALEVLTGGTVEVLPAARPTRFPSPGSLWTWARALATRTPVPKVAVRDRAIARRLRRTAHLYDAVVLLDNAVAVYMPDLARARAVLVDVHNVAGWSLQATGAHRTGSPAARAAALLRLGLMRSWERRSLGAASSVVVTSSAEADRLQRLYGLEASAVVASGATFPDQPAAGPGTGTIGWLGGLGYGPNRAGLLRFLDEGWPALADAGLKLVVAGPGADDAVMAHHGSRGVSVVGFVDDVDDFLRTIDVAVVPLWDGAGVKLKTVTFLGAGVPVVSTPVGVEGIAAEHGIHAWIAETPESLADGLRAVLAEQGLARSMAQAGRSLAHRTLGWDVCGGAFADAVDAVMAQPPAAPDGRRPGGVRY